MYKLGLRWGFFKYLNNNNNYIFHLNTAGFKANIAYGTV